MKTLKLIAAGFILFLSSNSQAQVSVNVNIGTAPSWGPSGYTNVDYYYIPDIESYYDIRLSQFIYFNNGEWVHSRKLPKYYTNYDLYHGYKVVLTDYHGRAPYKYFKNHKVKYYKGYKGKPQKMIGYKNDDHYENQKDKFDKKEEKEYYKHEKGNKKH